ncbi:MAG TPA: AmmeMemoRadiSam system protein B, partial [Candidatus Methylacidiphilales bacterium]
MTTPRSKLVLPARCAGVCYPREADACLDYFRGFFSQQEGDGLALWEPDADAGTDLPAPRVILTPHIDFRVSGAAYGHAFAPWARRAATADLYVILGVGHRASLPWSLDGRDYATPLGTVPSAAEEILDVVARCHGLPLGEAAAHVGEHSIEFPLVLLQALRRLRGIDRP